MRGTDIQDSYRSESCETRDRERGERQKEKKESREKRKRKRRAAQLSSRIIALTTLPSFMTKLIGRRLIWAKTIANSFLFPTKPYQISPHLISAEARWWNFLLDLCISLFTTPKHWWRLLEEYIRILTLVPSTWPHESASVWHRVLPLTPEVTIMDSGKWKPLERGV